MCRYADHSDATFGREPGKRRGYCGHEEIELALVKLYYVTDEPRYLKLAQYFIDERGQQPHYFDLEARARGEDPRQFWAKSYAYMQAHMPVREQTEVVGHAVRAMYLYSAMADAAREIGDAHLLAACERLWQGLVSKRMYLTGGIGAARSNEGFTADYDLPDETAYAETCAAVGMILWNHRLLQIKGHGQYADVMERVLYNGALSGVSLDGRRFFYDNPLASRGDHHRQEWFDCACCPPNIARLIASIGSYIYSQGEQDAWVHLFVQGEGKLTVAGQEMLLRQTSCYPWDGAVSIEVKLAARLTFTLHLRMPGWCQRARLQINDEVLPIADLLKDAYIHIARQWQPGDRMTFNMSMPVRYVYAHPEVHQMLGRVAIQRGPIVYCLEGVDHPAVALDRIWLDTDMAPHRAFRPEYRSDLLGGVMVLRGKGMLVDDREWDNRLYRFDPPRSSPIALTAVPYCVWDNRAPGEMRAWLRCNLKLRFDEQANHPAQPADDQREHDEVRQNYNRKPDQHVADNAHQRVEQHRLRVNRRLQCFIRVPNNRKRGRRWSRGRCGGRCVRGRRSRYGFAQIDGDRGERGAAGHGIQFAFDLFNLSVDLAELGVDLQGLFDVLRFDQKLADARGGGFEVA